MAKAPVICPFAVRDGLSALGLRSFLKTTGGKGLHVVVPITRHDAWDEAKAFTKAFADWMVRRAPDRYVATMSKSQRRGKIFIDYVRNSRGATAICAYSTRARPGATVSTPIDWSELDARLDPRKFTIDTVPARLDKLGDADPWAALPSTRQRITQAMLTALKR